ncbi:MAG: hypothetical protein MN733_01620, partial [Nitrososphaera sp.]|nr:hypothetical protein [Nitrososphaera sp.]
MRSARCNRFDPDYTNNTIEERNRVEKQLADGYTGACLGIAFDYQGSVTNDTHIRAHSDVDLLTVERRFCVIEPPNVPQVIYQGDPSLRKRLCFKVLLPCTVAAVILLLISAVLFRTQLRSSFGGRMSLAVAPRHLLDLRPENTPIPYPPGSKVGGIVWTTNLIPFKIMIETKEAIRDFDMKIMLDDGETAIKDIGQITAFSGMTVVPTMELD